MICRGLWTWAATCLSKLDGCVQHEEYTYIFSGHLISSLHLASHVPFFFFLFYRKMHLILLCVSIDFCNWNCTCEKELVSVYLYDGPECVTLQLMSNSCWMHSCSEIMMVSELFGRKICPSCSFKQLLCLLGKSCMCMDCVCGCWEMDKRKLMPSQQHLSARKNSYPQPNRNGVPWMSSLLTAVSRGLGLKKKASQQLLWAIVCQDPSRDPWRHRVAYKKWGDNC